MVVERRARPAGWLDCPACGEMHAPPDIVEFVKSPCYLGDTSIGPAQISILKAIYGLEMTPEELAIFLRMTDDRPPRKGGYQEATIITGQRCGKTDKIGANIGVYEAWSFDASVLSPGEWAYVMMVAQDAEGAKQLRDYTEGKLLLLEEKGHEILDHGTAQEKAITGKEIRTNRRVKFKIFPCKKAAVRSKTGLCGIADELGWWMTEEIAYNQDEEIIRSMRGRGATLGRRAKLIKISSPYAEAGVLWNDYQARHTTRNLVVNAPSWVLFPGLDQEFLDRERDNDPVAFLRDYGGQFGKAGGAYISPDDLDKCINKARPAILPPQSGIAYQAWVDVGFKKDRYVLGIGHAEGEKVIADLIQIWKGSKKEPLDGEKTAAEAAEILRAYGLDSVKGDQYAGALVVRDYQKAGIIYQETSLNDDELFDRFRDFKAAIRRALLDLPADQLVRQDILSLQSRKRGNGFKIAAPDRMGFYDDVSNVLAKLRHDLAPMVGRVELREVNDAGMPHRRSGLDWRDPEDKPEFGGGIMDAVY